MKRSYALEGIRADNWLEQLGEGSPGFNQLCEVVGTSYVAFSIIAGVRISALTVDPRNPDASLVDFQLGEVEGMQRVTLGEFRHRLAHAMLSRDPVSDLPDEPSDEDLQAYVGFRYVLLAPIYEIGLDTLTVGEDGKARVTFEADGQSQESSLEEFRERIRNHIRREAADHQAAASPFSIDLKAIEEARAASDAGEFERVTELLGSWPGPLSLLLRTADGQQLNPEVRGALAEAMGMLGSAFAGLGKHEWAHEVLRLGIQWGQEQRHVSAELFRRFGAAHLEEERYGEAIGLLRRAIGLGARDRDAMPHLALAFARRQRYLASVVCWKRAIEDGAEEGGTLGPLRAEAIEVLGQAGFDTLIEMLEGDAPLDDSTTDTEPPEPPEAAESGSE